MSNSIRAPFPWFGGKGNPKIKNFVLKNLPPHTRYIEPFGGGGSILIAKDPAEVEVYNDVNRGVVNFFRVIASRDYFGPFWLASASCRTRASSMRNVSGRGRRSTIRSSRRFAGTSWRNSHSAACPENRGEPA